MKTPAERQRIERLLDVHRNPAGHAEGLEAEDAAARELYGEYVAEHGHEAALVATARRTPRATSRRSSR